MVMREPDTPLQMMINLGTETNAEGRENVQKTILRMKSADSFQDKVKSLSGVLKTDLVQTFAFLLATDIEDARVIKLTMPGLHKMIALRVFQLMPQVCFPVCKGALFW